MLSTRTFTLIDANGIQYGVAVSLKGDLWFPDYGSTQGYKTPRLAAVAGGLSCGVEISEVFEVGRASPSLMAKVSSLRKIQETLDETIGNLRCEMSSARAVGNTPLEEVRGCQIQSMKALRDLLEQKIFGLH